MVTSLLLLLCAQGGESANCYQKIRPILVKLESTHKFSKEDKAFILKTLDSESFVCRAQASLAIEAAVTNGAMPFTEGGRLIEKKMSSAPSGEASIYAQAYQAMLLIPVGNGKRGGSFIAQTHKSKENVLSPEDKSLLSQCLIAKNENRFFAAAFLVNKRSLPVNDAKLELSLLDHLAKTAKGKEKIYWQAVERVFRTRNGIKQPG